VGRKCNEQRGEKSGGEKSLKNILADIGKGEGVEDEEGKEMLKRICMYGKPRVPMLEEQQPCWQE
jgi:hypothetical protein